MSEHYNRIVTEAREEDLADLVSRTRQQLGREYVRALDEAFEESVEEPEAFAQAYRTAMAEFAREGGDSVRDATLLMIRRTEEAHVRAAEKVFEDAELLADLNDAFEDFPDRAYQNMWTRRQLGAVGEFQSLRRWQGSADLVGRILQDRISEGLSADEAASRIMRGLVQGDEELAQIARDYGPRGGLTRDAVRRGVEFDEDAARIARRIGNDARRISRTEMATAYHEADREAARRSPAVKGLKWTLSSAHPETDECDVLAEQDAYGLGPGVYPPDKIPSLPHPNCKCSTRSVLWDPDEYGNELEVGDPSLPQDAEGVPDSAVRNARQQIQRFA